MDFSDLDIFTRCFGGESARRQDGQCLQGMGFGGSFLGWIGGILSFLRWEKFMDIFELGNALPPKKNERAMLGFGVDLYLFQIGKPVLGSVRI